MLCTATRFLEESLQLYTECCNNYYRLVFSIILMSAWITLVMVAWIVKFTDCFKLSRLQ